MKSYIELLLKWYQKNKRDLPWRRDRDPYHVWVSEIMLQQTRIEAVIQYYNRFMKRVPSIQALSNISEDELLKLWEGLGYYSRARNLKKAAQIIVNQFNGVFPSNYQDILSLPGIGEYTAGAISSICFNHPFPAIDGNVMRVYVRIHNFDYDISDLKVKKKIGLDIQKIIPAESGNFNQALMELGELICIPNGTPKCELCPVKDYCQAHQYGRESILPKKGSKIKKVEEKYTVFLIKCHNRFAILKRTDGLLKNMWEFPNRNGFFTYSDVKKEFTNCQSLHIAITNTHIFTHKKWNMKSYFLEVSAPLPEYTWATICELEENYAIPSAFSPFLEYIKTDKS